MFSFQKIKLTELNSHLTEFKTTIRTFLTRNKKFIIQINSNKLYYFLDVFTKEEFQLYFAEYQVKLNVSNTKKNENKFKIL